jgi:2-deoxy-D-gluconate 3-dehydrogenase
MAALSDFDISGRVVAVTGAGRGIGRAIALDVAKSGALVAACSRTQSELDTLAKEIADFGGRCATTVIDLSTVEGAQQFVDFTVETYGRIDGIVNNAGVNTLKDALDYTEEEFDVMLDLNLKSIYFLCTAAARQMIKQGDGGGIVNITSQAGVVGAPGRAPYSAFKAGANNLTRTLAAEWATHQIRVNAVAPTVTLTPLAEKAMNDRPGFREEVSARILLGRPAEVREMSLPVVFLLSSAASMITGHILVVDGGWTIV